MGKTGKTGPKRKSGSKGIFKLFIQKYADLDYKYPYNEEESISKKRFRDDAIQPTTTSSIQKVTSSNPKEKISVVPRKPFKIIRDLPRNTKKTHKRKRYGNYFQAVFREIFKTVKKVFQGKAKKSVNKIQRYCLSMKQKYSEKDIESFERLYELFNKTKDNNKTYISIKRLLEQELIMGGDLCQVCLIFLPQKPKEDQSRLCYEKWIRNSNHGEEEKEHLRSQKTITTFTKQVKRLMAELKSKLEDSNQGSTADNSDHESQCGSIDPHVEGPEPFIDMETTATNSHGPPDDSQTDSRKSTPHDGSGGSMIKRSEDEFFKEKKQPLEASQTNSNKNRSFCCALISASQSDSNIVVASVSQTNSNKNSSSFNFNNQSPQALSKDDFPNSDAPGDAPYLKPQEFCPLEKISLMLKDEKNPDTSSQSDPSPLKSFKTMLEELFKELKPFGNEKESVKFYEKWSQIQL